MDNIEEIKKIVNESGNNFHCKVINYFKEKEWYPLVSPYYTDFVSNKPREIDIVTEKSFPTNFIQNRGTINVKLYIECKYIPDKQNIVFWFSEKDKERSINWIVKNTPIKENNVHIKQHHYTNENNNEVAKLFASNPAKQTENESIFKAINQCLNGIVYNKRSHSIIPNQRLPVQKIVHYPIIVFNNFDNFYYVKMDNDDDPKKIDKNFQLEVNYAYLDQKRNAKNDYFLIDFIEFKRLDEFLIAINKDIEAIDSFIWNN